MEPVGLGARSPDLFGPLSQFLGIKSQIQGLAGQAAEVAGAEQTQRQRQGLAEFDIQKHRNPDGTFNLQSAIVDPELRAAAGDQYVPYIQSLASANQSIIESKNRLLALTNDQRETLNGIVGALIGDKDVAEDSDEGRKKLNSAMIEFGKVNPDSLDMIASYSNQIRQVPRGGLQTALKFFQRQAMDASSQRQSTLPQFANTGGELTNINPDMAPGSPASLKATIAPGFRMYTDERTGNSYLINDQTGETRDVGAGFPGASPNRGRPSPSASPSAPIRPSSLPTPLAPGQMDEIKANQDEVRNIRATADQAPMQRNVFRNILKLSENTSTGPLVKFLQETKVGGQVFGDNYQELAKYLERNAIGAMQAMGGPPSDGRLNAAVAATGSTGFNREALRSVTQFNYAANTGLEMYRQGMDAAIGTTNPDYRKLAEFKKQWSQNFDIDAFRLENAINDGDKKMQNEILKGLTKEQAAALARKMRNLDSLAETGTLPK